MRLSGDGEPEPGLGPGLGVRVVYWMYKTLVSPVVHAFSPSQCVYLPTCSEYAYVALVRFGVLKGSWLALRRVGRCHPFARGGLDPVPERVSGGGENDSTSADIQADTGADNRADHLP
jgi:uncharacterized protein